MSLETVTRIFVLDEMRDAKVNAIAAQLSAELGVKISRSEAVRVLIDRFFVPDWSFKGPKSAEKTEQAA